MVDSCWGIPLFVLFIWYESVQESIDDRIY